MKRALQRFLSHDAGPVAQFVKYGAVGVAATLCQLGVFYLLASFWLQCLGADDFAVKTLGLPAAEAGISDATRSWRFVVDTACGFTVANVFCWLMNRAFVFRPGRFPWFAEFCMFFGVAALAMGLAAGVCWLLINFVGLMTTLAVVLEVMLSFLLNYFARKFLIFNR